MDSVAERRDRNRLVEIEKCAHQSDFLGTTPSEGVSDWKKWTWERKVRSMTPDLLEITEASRMMVPLNLRRNPGREHVVDRNTSSCLPDV